MTRYAGIIAGKNSAFIAVVESESAPPKKVLGIWFILNAKTRFGGAAGYCPRVQSVYSTLRLLP